MSMTDLYKVFDQTVREITREVNRSILKVPEIEQKTLDATSNEPWGPHGQLMNEIARATRNFHEYQMIMAILWKRLQDTGPNWRHVYKTLVVMEFLVANGSDRVLDELRENIYQIQSLMEFQFTEPNGKDQGINVRKKAQTLVSLLKDREAIRQAREKAASNRNKYGGMSSSAFRSGGFGNTAGGDFDSYRSRDDYDNYGSREGGAGRRGSTFEEEPYGRRERDGDRYGRERDRHDKDEEPRRGSGARRDWDDDDDGFKKDGYSRAGETALQDDDDFEPRGKSGGGGGGVGGPAAGDDFDDFDPRATAKPTTTAAAAPSAAVKPAPVAAPAPAPAPVANLLDDLLGPSPVAPTPAVSAPVDPFAALTTPAPTTSGNVDLFGAPAAAPASAGVGVGFSAFSGASPAAGSASDDFADDDFGGFAAAPSSASTAAPAAFGSFASAPAVPKDPFSNNSVDPFAGLTSSAGLATKATAGAGIGKPAAAAPVSKSGLWDDVLSKGVVDLKISSGKEELTSVGIMGDNFGVSSATLNAASNIPYYQQAGGMGRAMGTGSGKGISGAGTITSPPFGSAGYGGPGGGLSGLGGFNSPPGLGAGVQQPAAMGFGAFPSPGMPGGAGFGQQQQQPQQSQYHGGMGSFQF